MLVGRDAEQTRIDALLSRARAGQGSALVVRGEPGIGKTSLLAHAVARAGPMRVVRARGVESEAELAFSGLLELLHPLLDFLDSIPEPQANALRSAFGLGPPLQANPMAVGGA